jgi:hypothetical protein
VISRQKLGSIADHLHLGNPSFPGLSWDARDPACCLPCRRSRVRIPSAALKKTCICGPFRLRQSAGADASLGTEKTPVAKIVSTARRWGCEPSDLQGELSGSRTLDLLRPWQQVEGSDSRLFWVHGVGFRRVDRDRRLGSAASTHVLTSEVDGPGRLSSWLRPSSGESTAGDPLGRAVRLTGGASRRLRSPTNNRRSDSRCGSGRRPDPRARRSRVACPRT